MATLACSSSTLLTTVAMFGSLVASIMSIYLMYVLAYVLETVCLVCIPVHFINLIVFILYTTKWSRMVQAANKSLKTD